MGSVPPRERPTTWGREQVPVQDVVECERSARTRPKGHHMTANPEPGFSFLAELTVHTGEPIDAGPTPLGHRRVIPITGGTVTGRIQGDVLPLGADWNLVRADGSASVDARYLVRTHDGAVLTVTNTGVLTSSGSLTSPRIEAAEGPYRWLNDAPLVGTLVPLVEDDVTVGVSLEFHLVTVS